MNTGGSEQPEEDDQPRLKWHVHRSLLISFIDQPAPISAPLLPTIVSSLVISDSSWRMLDSLRPEFLEAI